MAETTKTKTTPETTAAEPTLPENTPAEKTDYIKKIGRNFNLEKAKNLFGADLAVEAMDAVARAGGYGDHGEDDYKNPYFGGFAIPDPRTIDGDTPDDDERRNHYEAVRTKINNALNRVK